MTSQTLQIPADLGHSAKVRETGRAFFLAAGFADSGANRLVLVLDEIFMNAVKYGCHPEQCVTLMFTATPEGVRCAVTDGGAAGISPENLRATIENHGATHTPHKTSGRGLAIITHAWTDGYEITTAENGGLTITFWKQLGAQSATQKAEIRVEPTAPIASSDTTFTFAWTGEIDEHNLELQLAPVEKWLTDSAHTQLILDFAQVSFINSSVLGQLARLHSELTARGGALKIQNTSAAVFEILDLTGLATLLQVTKH